MAIFTHLGVADLTPLMETLFDRADVLALDQISEGIENSNYLLRVRADGLKGSLLTGVPALRHRLPAELAGESGAEFIVTVVEMMDWASLEIITDSILDLAESGLQVPGLLVDADGKGLFRLEEKSGQPSKPLVCVPRLAGRTLDPAEVTARHCQQIGRFLGRLHRQTLASQSQSAPRQQYWADRRYDWMLSRLDDCMTWCTDDELPALQQIEDRLHSALASALLLPCSWTHGDLFVDNALFHGSDENTHPDTLSGVIDFYRAGMDSCGLDLATAVNDWCWRNGLWDETLTEAMLAGYRSERLLSQAEEQLWPELLGFAALRFYAARMVSAHTESYQKQASMNASGAANVLKDPQPMLQKMQAAVL